MNTHGPGGRGERRDSGRFGWTGPPGAGGEGRRTRASRLLRARRLPDPDDVRELRGSGLQAERTLLAWQRTLIVLIAVGLLYLRDPFQSGEAQPGADPLYRLIPVLAVLAALGWLIVHLRGRWRGTEHGLHDDRTGRPPAPVARPWALVLTSASVAILAVAVAAGAVLG